MEIFIIIDDLYLYCLWVWHTFYFESCNRKHLRDAARNLMAANDFPRLTNHRLFEKETWDCGVTEEGELFSATRRNKSIQRKINWPSRRLLLLLFYRSFSVCEGPEVQQLKWQLELSVYFWYLGQSATPSRSATGKKHLLASMAICASSTCKILLRINFLLDENYLCPIKPLLTERWRLFAVTGVRRVRVVNHMAGGNFDIRKRIMLNNIKSF